MQTQEKSNGQLDTTAEAETMELIESLTDNDTLPFQETKEEEDTPSAKVATSELKVKRKDIFEVPFTQLRLLPNFNVRVDYGDIPELARQIKSEGVKVPLMGFRDKDEEGNEVWVVVQGHRRHAACKLLYEQDGLEVAVPFLLEPKGTTMEQRLFDTKTTNSGKTLTKVEDAELVRRGLAYKYSIKRIAERMGISEAAVRDLEKLANAPESLKILVSKEAITYSAAISAIDNNVVDKVLEMHEERIESNLQTSGSDFDPATTLALNTGDSGAPVDLTYKKADKKKSTKISAADVAAAAGKVNSYKELKVFMESADTDGFTEAGLEVYKLLDRLIRNDLTVKKLQIWFKNKI